MTIMRQRKYFTKNKNKITEILELLTRQDFDSAIQKLRKKHPVFLLPKFTREGFEIVDIKVDSLAIFNKDIDILLAKFNLPHTWDTFIRRYIISNEFWPKDNYDPNGVVIEKENGKVFLLLHKKLTNKDIFKVWSLIEKEIGKPNHNRKRSKSNFDRNYAILKMAEDGKSIKEIYNEILKTFKEDLDFGLIKHIVSMMKKTHGSKNKKYKLKTEKDIT